MRFMIDKIPVIPEEMIQVPNGDILTAAFVGSVPHVWLKVNEGDDRTMGLIVLPNGGPYKLEETDDFFAAEFATSFLARSTLKTTKPHDIGIAFHVFIWKPKIVLASMLVQ